MPEFLQYPFDRFVAAFSNLSERLSQSVVMFGNDTDSVPVEFGVPRTQSLKVFKWEIASRVESSQSFDQKCMPFLRRQQSCCVQSRLMPVIALQRRVNSVPVQCSEMSDEIRLPEVLTFINCFLEFLDPLSLMRVWPLETTATDSTRKCCNSVARMYLPDLGTFHAESPPILWVYSATFLLLRKVFAR